MPLHSAKRTALLNSLNCVSSNDLISLKDLSDGKCLVNILSTTFNNPSDHLVESFEFVTAPSEKDTSVIEESKTAGSVDITVAESAVVSEAECTDDVFMVEFEDTNTKEEIVAQPIQSPDDVEVISQRFKLIQNFIDERYNLKSEEIVSYCKCMEANEFELAKVAFFVLSELVKYFIHINNDHLRTLAHLDIRIQEDLEECFHLFISERENLSKKGVEKVLSSHAKYKSRSPLKSPFTTPRRNCASKYRIDFLTTPTNEEVYSNSPLKSFFESPIFRKEDILLKEKEIIKVRKDLVEEEFKSEEFQFQLNEAKKKIEEKDKEIKKLKATIKIQESDKKFQDYEDELKQLQVKYDSLKKESEYKYKKYEEEISELMKHNGFLEFEVKTFQAFSRYENLNDKNLQYELEHKDALLEKRNEMLQHYRRKQSSSFIGIDKMQNMLDAVTEELNAERQKLKDMEIQSAKDQEFYAAKLSDLEQAIKNESNSPGLGENLGVVIENENRILQSKLDVANLKIKQLEKKLQNMGHPENNVPISKYAFNRSIVEILDLPETPKRISKKHSTSLRYLAEDDKYSPEALKKHSDKGKELTDLQVECDISSNFEVASKNSPSSLHSEVVPLTENTSEPGVEVYGSLWRDLDNSSLETENTDAAACISDLNRPRNCDKLMNRDLNLSVCSKCNNIPNKNGFNWNAIHFGKMAKMTEELEKKEEEIDRLKANNETLQQKSVEYLEQLDEKNKEIEDLKHVLKNREDKLKLLCTNFSRCKKRLVSAEEKARNYDILNPKLKQMEIFVKKCKTSHSEEIESLKSSRRKKDQEISYLKCEVLRIGQDVKNLMNKNESLNKRIYSLEKEKEGILKKFMETERKLLRMKKVNYERILSRESKVQETVTVVDKEGKEQSADCTSSVAFYVELNGDVSKDVNNESIVSGALYKKNGISLNSFRMNGEDEDSFFNHTSLPCPSEKDKRLDELIRRNSILPHHLQSSYPVEMNLTLNTDKFYVKNPENDDDMKSENPEINETVPSDHQSKKRKLQEPDTQSIEVVSTPVAKVRKTFKTPSSLKKLLHFSRSRRNGVVKPKP